MEKYLNKFLESDYTLIDFCKSYNLNKKDFESFLQDNNYISGNSVGKEVLIYHKAILKYKTSDLNCAEIAKEFGISKAKLSYALKKLNLWDPKVHKCRKKSYNENIFDSIDTEEKAYWLGYIFADGYIYNLHPRSNSGRIDYNFELCSKGSDAAHM